MKKRYFLAVCLLTPNVTAALARPTQPVPHDRSSHIHDRTSRIHDYPSGTRSQQ